MSTHMHTVKSLIRLRLYVPQEVQWLFFVTLVVTLLFRVASSFQQELLRSSSVDAVWHLSGSTLPAEKKYQNIISIIIIINL